MLLGHEFQGSTERLKMRAREAARNISLYHTLGQISHLVRLRSSGSSKSVVSRLTSGFKWI